MKRVILFGGVTALALATSAFAQDQAQTPVPPRGPIFDFAQADADGDGKLTMEEIQAQGKARMAERFAEADADGDGAISAEEMVASMEARAEAQRQQRMQRMADRMLKRADTDGDGVLSLEEMTPSEAPRGADRMFSRIDSDQDGAISAEEFETAQAKMAERMSHGPRGERDGDREGGPRKHFGPRGGERGGDHDGPRDRDHGPRGDGLMPFFFFGGPEHG